MNHNYPHFIAALILAFALPSVSIAADEPAANAPQASAATVDHQREGTRLSAEQGHFRATGDRLTFHLRESEQVFPCLENLALERIAKIVGDRHEDPGQSVWEVSGTFTEYRGSNYLLITHGVLKNKTRRRVSSP